MSLLRNHLIAQIEDVKSYLESTVNHLLQVIDDQEEEIEDLKKQINKLKS